MNPRPCKNCDFSLESISVCCGAWVRSCAYLRLAGISRHVGCQGQNGLVLLTLSSAGVVPYRRFATRLRCSAADAERSCPGTNLGIICDDWSASQTAIPALSTSTLSAPTKEFCHRDGSRMRRRSASSLRSGSAQLLRLRVPGRCQLTSGKSSEPTHRDRRSPARALILRPCDCLAMTFKYCFAASRAFDDTIERKRVAFSAAAS
jgi:hypothetical protein